MLWTTDDLLSTIRSRQMFPTASKGSLSDPVLLQFATEELYITLLPLIFGLREKYYETYVDTVYADNITALPIPSRSIGGTTSVVQHLYGFEVNDLDPIDQVRVSTSQGRARPSNIYFQNNSICFYPPPAGAEGTIRIRYFQRPNRLEQTANCGQITAVDPVAMTVTISGTTVPTTWTTMSTFDFIPATANQATPYGLNSSVSDITNNILTFYSLPVGPTFTATTTLNSNVLTAVSSMMGVQVGMPIVGTGIPANAYILTFTPTTITISSAATASATGITMNTYLPAIGDWMALAEYTPIPEIPFEMQAVLAQVTALRALYAIKDKEGAAIAEKNLNAMLQNSSKLLTARDQGGMKRVVNSWRNF